MAPVSLYGRDLEIDAIDCCLQMAREGHFCGVQLVGAPGVGKTALCERAADLAVGFHVDRAGGVETEEDLPLAALSGVLTHLPQHRGGSASAALASVERVRDALAGNDRLALGALVLDLFSRAAEEHPLLLVLDDWHWFDAASVEALSFAFHRLDADRVAVVLAERAGACATAPLPRVPPLILRDLPTAAAWRLLGAELGDLASAVGVEVITGTGGNPLALKEVAKNLTEGERAGTARLRQPVDVGDRLNAYYHHLLQPLSAESKLALATVGAAGSAPELVEPALTRLGISLRELEDAEALDVITVGERGVWEFRHPLLRTASLGVVPAGVQRRIHRALAEAAASDLPRHAFHLAAAAAGPSREVGDALAELAREAELRGGRSMAAGILEGAAQLTPAGELRARRFLAAAKAALLSGATSKVVPLLDHVVKTVPGSDLAREAALVGAQALLWSNVEKAVDQALAAARPLAMTRPQVAIDGLAMGATGLLTRGEHAAAIRIGKEGVELARARGVDDLALLGGLTGSLVIAGRRSEAGKLLTPDVLDRCLTLLREPGSELPTNSTLIYLAQTLRWCDRHPEAEELARALAEHCRGRSAPYALPYPLCVLCDTLWWNGRWAEARSVGEEGLELAEQTGQYVLSGFVRAQLARLWSARGDVAHADNLAAAAIRVSSQTGIRPIHLFSLAAKGLGRLANGNADDAVTLLRNADSLAGDMGVPDDSPTPYVAELIEALWRCGEQEEAERRLDGYLRLALREGGPYRLATALRCRALLAGGTEADDLYRRALRANPGLSFEEARIRFCWGEALRRRRRPAEARQQLEHAAHLFQTLGAESYARRAQQELEPLGIRVHAVRASGVEELTSRELQVALSVAEGRSNRDIASRLFISQKTVEYHLGNVFMKLGINSRTQLVMLLPRVLPSNSHEWPAGLPVEN
ncbi:MAG: AAA family ATPase [Candidatus Dormibacteraeota bacterium]|nr:AAA family ATPase [Candidatus Dormibacteraeota bacterium]